MCQLFMKYMNRNEIDHAIEIEKKCKVANATYTPQMLSTCVKLWTATKDSNQAITDLEELQNMHQNFKIHEYKIVDLMTLLIDENRLEKAYEILSNSSHCKAPDLESLSKHIRQLLSAVCDYAIRNNITENMSQQMLNELLKKHFCKRSNVVLGAVIQEYLDKKQLQKAIEAFEEFATKYQVTPQLLKLLIILIEQSNATENENNSSINFDINKKQAVDYLQRIFDILNTLYDAKKANVKILLGFACAGSEQQLQKLLKDPSEKFDKKTLENGLKNLRDLGRVDAIIAIARSARGLQYSILDEENLYDLLMSHFEQKNDFKSAIQLYEELVKDSDHRVSKQFNRIFKNLLVKNNQKLPESMHRTGVVI